MSSTIGCTVLSFTVVGGRGAREQGKRLAAGCQDRAWQGAAGLHLRLRFQLARLDVIFEEPHDNDPDRVYSAFVFGETCRPPKDAGGLDEFMGYLKADQEPAHGRIRDTVRWFGGAFDPGRLSEARARFGFENMTRRRGP